MKKIRDLLAEGLLLALPLGAAAYLLHKVIGLISKLLIPVAHLLPNARWFGIAGIEIAAFLLLLLGLVLLGAFARSKLGRKINRVIEEVILSKVPFYLIIKNIITDVTNTESATDLQPALVSFDDNAVLGFIVEESDDKSMYTVFIPSAPSAATGSVVLMPKSRVQLLDAPTMAAMRAMKQRGLGLQALNKAEG
jgi:uncharacterized membrane protein